MENSSKTARVVLFTETGGSEVLKIESVEVPAPTAQEVRIRVKAIGINRADSMYRKGEYMEQPVFPARIGYEAAGIVDAAGSDVTGIEVGDVVSVIPAFSLNQYATHGELVLVPAYSVEKHPSTLSFEQAAALWSTYLTSYGLLVDSAKLTAGQTVIITAASSGVGLAAIQTANAVGAISIAVTTTASKRDALLKAGAAYVIITAEQDVVAEINRITDGKGADVVIDAVGGTLLGQLITAMAVRGKIFIYGNLSPELTAVPSMEILAKNLTITGFTVSEVNIDPVRQQAAKSFIYDGLNTGKLKPVIAKTFPFDQIVEAHRFLESNKQVGKIVVTL